jgi:hypothetical protein
MLTGHDLSFCWRSRLFFPGLTKDKPLAQFSSNFIRKNGEPFWRNASQACIVYYVEVA